MIGNEVTSTEELLLKRMLRVETVLNVDRVIASKFEDVLNDESLYDLLKNTSEIDWKSKLGLDCKCVGISSLQVFVKQNWLFSDVGLNEKLVQFLNENKDDLSVFCQNDEVISCDAQLKYSFLLSIAYKYLVVKSMRSLGDFVWCFRTLFVNQMILKEASERIYNEVQKYTKLFDDYLDDYADNLDDYESKLMFLQSCVELSQIYLWFKDVHNSEKYLMKAQKFSEVTLNLSGALGKRTKFQTKATSQLTVEIHRRIPREIEVNANPLTYPKNVALDNETLLQNIEFVSQNEKCTALLPEEQSLMLASVNLSLKGGPHDDVLIKEESLTYLEYIIRETQNWCLRFKALHLRCFLEQENKKIERTMTQLNELVDCYKDSAQRNINKLDLFYGTSIEPVWLIEKSFADCLLKMGCVKAALDVYLRLQIWESIVQCYQILEKKEKAESVVRERLKIEKTPDLLCLLGDITTDLSYYDEAWNLSNNKSSRSKRSIGDYYFQRKEYEKCLEPYQISLQLNSLQLYTWQRLGYAALETQNYELSAKA
ncbi:tetratricopeptide repeat protein 27-like protein, partial [Leptotrombidium deliense]